MPLLIRELHIRVTVDNPTNNAGASTSSPPNTEGEAAGDAKATIVQECVEEVLEILRFKMMEK